MVGRMLGGYRLEEQIGEGGFGKVYRAVHVDMDRVAAVKVARETRFGQMLVSEGKLLAKLSHPNIVDIVHMDAQGDPPFVVMEYVDGESLATRLKRGPLSARQAIKLALPLLAALAAAHELGILHRDIKPSNILIAADGTPKLADFGLGRVVAEESLRMSGASVAAATSMRRSQMSQSGSEGAEIVGTIAYMSPEQMDGQSIDARSDLYSLGVVLYEAVTGKLPVGRFKLPGELFAGVPEKLDALLDAVLAPEPAARPESSAAAVRLLQSSVEPSATITPAAPQKSEEGPQPAAPPKGAAERWADAEAYCARMRLSGRPDAEIADGLRRAGWRQEQIERLLGGPSSPATAQPASPSPAASVPDVTRTQPPQPSRPQTPTGAPASRPRPGAGKGIGVSRMVGVAVVGAVGAALILLIVLAVRSGSGASTSAPPVAGGAVAGGDATSSRPGYVSWVPRGTGSAAGDEVVGPHGGQMVWVPAGSFMMGSEEHDGEKPVHRVELDGFWMGKTEVTVGEWRSVMGSVPGEYNDQGDNHPVVEVTWDDCREFCLRTGVELPTEAQWEYAARGPESLVYPWGNQWDDRRCSHAYNKGPGGRTYPVGSFPSGVSWCGALDMAGNVQEWCADWYGGDYYGESPTLNPGGPSSGKYRVVRGGSWGGYAPGVECRSANRGSNSPGYTWYRFGFRVSRSVR